VQHFHSFRDVLRAAPHCRHQLTLSTVRGTAADPTGAVIAGAEITVVNQQPTRTNGHNQQQRDYEIADLVSRQLRLTATQPGFKTFIADDVVVEGREVRRVNIVFEIGAGGNRGDGA